uniref:STAS domain-containing protein n=1 Tax=Gracilinema caldarium TaxID=215591 RepID=A0A7C3E8R9_9SPIR
MTNAPHISTNVPPQKLEWKGALSIEDAGPLHKALLDAFQNKQPIYLDLSRVTDMDSAIIQLICSAFKEALEEGMEFHLTGTVQDSLQSTLVRYGFIIHEESTGEGLEKQWCIQQQGSL